MRFMGRRSPSTRSLDGRGAGNEHDAREHRHGARTATFAICLLALVAAGFAWFATEAGTLFARGFSVLTAAETESETELTGAAEMAEMRYKQRSAGRDSIPQGWLLDAIEHVKGMPGPEERDGGIWDWYWLGPGNIGGRSRTILVHPTDPNRMWVGGVSGGIWRTTNAGTSWTPVNDFLPSLCITSLVMDPTNANVMYAATGEGITGGPDPRVLNPPGAGIFRSTDGGASWTQLANTANWRYVNKLAHHPSSANTLYACSETPTQVARSTDGGQNWTPVLTGIDRPVDIEIHPAVHGRMYVACLGSTGSVWRSNDGVNFSQLTIGGSNNLPSNGGRCEIELAQPNTNTIYVQIDSNGGQIWRSTLAGDLGTWTLQGTSGALVAQGWYNNALWVDPTTPNRLLAGGIELFRSTNAGVNWTRVSNGGLYDQGTSGHVDYHEIVSHASYNGTSNRTVFVGNDGGIQKITDVATVAQATGWTNLANGLGITQFYHGAASPDASLILGGTQDNSFPTWAGGGTEDWFLGNIMTDGCVTAVDPNTPSIVYADTPYLGMLKSTNGGVTYNAINNGLDDSGSAGWVAPFVLDPNNSNVLVAGGKSLWRTINGGGEWDPIRPPVGATVLCTALGIKPGNSNEIWAGYTDGTVSRTTNGGATWADLDGGTPNLPNRYVMDLAVSPFFSNEAVVTFSGIFNNNVWATFNGGANWSQLTGAPPDDLPWVQVNTVTYHPVNFNWLYIGTDVGIFASEDFGGHWNVTPSWGNQDAPAYVEVNELFWAGNKMLAATWGRGMYLCQPLEVVYVDAANGGFEDGTQAHPWNTVREGEDMRGPGASLSIRASTYNEGSQLLEKRGLVVANGGTVVVR